MLEQVDGHLTSEPGLGLLVLVADCYPVALSNGERAAMLHCGWRPLAGGIIEKALARFLLAAGRGRGARDRRLLLPGGGGGAGGVIGHRRGGPPAACSTCASSSPRSSPRRAGLRFSTWTMRTSCEPELYFSHRRDGGVTGRQAGIIVRDGP